MNVSFLNPHSCATQCRQQSLLANQPRLEYLVPFWPVILVECGLATALHLALVLAVVAPNLYAVERSVLGAAKAIRI